jgi:hypothetical protein
MAVRLQALRPLFGSYNGTNGVRVDVGEVFECDPETAESLEGRGLASQYHGVKASNPIGRPWEPPSPEALRAMLARMRAKG